MLSLGSIAGRELDLFLDDITHWAADELPGIFGAVLLMMAGWWFAGRMHHATRRMLHKQTRIDPMLRGLIASVVHYGIFILVTIAALGQLGIQTTSILAALGAACLAIGLALQGTLSNIAAGIYAGVAAALSRRR
jgi:small conductance mechanosensitive channel